MQAGAGREGWAAALLLDIFLHVECTLRAESCPRPAWRHHALPPSIPPLPIGLTSDNVAERFNVPREVQDAAAVASHAKALKAQVGAGLGLFWRQGWLHICGHVRSSVFGLHRNCTSHPVSFAAAQEAGKFKDEIVPVETTQVIEKDGE